MVKETGIWSMWRVLQYLRIASVFKSIVQLDLRKEVIPRPNELKSVDERDPLGFRVASK